MTPFAKAHSLGNDFILIKSDDDFDISRIRLIADYKLGIGADQILCLNSKNQVKIWNHDGSAAQLCLGGLKALGGWIGKPVLFSTDAGVVKIANILQINTNTFDIQIELQRKPEINKDKDVFMVNIGNFHKIYVVDKEPILMPEAHCDYNIAYVWKEHNKWQARVVERGVGETLSCGSSALSIALILNQLGENDLDVYFSLGVIKHKKNGDFIMQIASIAIVAKGELYL